MDKAKRFHWKLIISGNCLMKRIYLQVRYDDLNTERFIQIGNRHDGEQEIDFVFGAYSF